MKLSELRKDAFYSFEDGHGHEGTFLVLQSGQMPVVYFEGKISIEGKVEYNSGLAQLLGCTMREYMKDVGLELLRPDETEAGFLIATIANVGYKEGRREISQAQFGLDVLIKELSISLKG